MGEVNGIEYMDLRLYFTGGGIKAELLGSGLLENKDILDLVVALQNVIKTSSLPEANKQKILELPLGKFSDVAEKVGQSFINAERKTFSSKEDALSPMLTRDYQAKQTLETFRASGNVKCPWCGISVKSMDGHVVCLNCSTDFGEL